MRFVTVHHDDQDLLRDQARRIGHYQPITTNYTGDPAAPIQHWAGAAAGHARRAHHSPAVSWHSASRAQGSARRLNSVQRLGLAVLMAMPGALASRSHKSWDFGAGACGKTLHVKLLADSTLCQWQTWLSISCLSGVTCSHVVRRACSIYHTGLCRRLCVVNVA